MGGSHSGWVICLQGYPQKTGIIWMPQWSIRLTITARDGLGTQAAFELSDAENRGQREETGGYEKTVTTATVAGDRNARFVQTRLPD